MSDLCDVHFIMIDTSVASQAVSGREGLQIWQAFLEGTVHGNRHEVVAGLLKHHFRKQYNYVLP